MNWEMKKKKKKWFRDFELFKIFNKQIFVEEIVKLPTNRMEGMRKMWAVRGGCSTARCTMHGRQAIV